MKFLGFLSLALLSACDNSNTGRYVPVSSTNGVHLVDTQTGRMYDLPVEHHDAGEPKPYPPLKWTLRAEL
jgi:hypothetical protein